MNKLFFLCATLGAAMVLACSAHALENGEDTIPEPSLLTLLVSPQATYVSYSNSPLRDNVMSAGMDLDVNYLERGGISIGYSNAKLTLKSNLTAIDQTSTHLSGRWNLTPDSLPGVLTAGLDGIQANNNDTTNETNAVHVVAPHLTFLDFNKNYYLDFGYARTTYGDSKIGNGSLTVDQLVPTVGIAFNQAGDWLQFSWYNIRFSNAKRAQQLTAVNALDTKWTHYFSGGGFVPEQIQLGGMLGQQIYAVDGGNVYNFSDIHKGGASASAQWDLGADVHLTLQSGYDLYDAAAVTGLAAASSYSALYAYLGVASQW